MKQLTRKEIIGLRARALWDFDQKSLENTESALTFEELEVFAITDFSYRQVLNDFLEQAQATIEADEKAGVLMLVDDGVQTGDLVSGDSGDYYCSGHYIYNEKSHKDYPDCFVEVIIQRNNTPAYNCKKEGE